VSSPRACLFSRTPIPLVRPAQLPPTHPRGDGWGLPFRLPLNAGQVETAAEDTAFPRLFFAPPRPPFPSHVDVFNETELAASYEAPWRPRLPSLSFFQPLLFDARNRLEDSLESTISFSILFFFFPPLFFRLTLF